MPMCRIPRNISCRPQDQGIDFALLEYGTRLFPKLIRKTWCPVIKIQRRADEREQLYPPSDEPLGRLSQTIF